MKKRGFTLIELLAVIIILGVIALITIPLVIRLINKSRADSAVRSAVNYVAGVKKAVLKTTGTSRFTATYCEVKDDGTGNLDCDDGTVLELEVEGNKPVAGIVYFDKGDVTYSQALRFGKYSISSNEQGEFTIDDEPKEIIKKNAFLEPEVSYEDADYKKGELIYVHNIPFWVLTNSSHDKDYVVAIKKEPLTVGELNEYGEGIINRYKGGKAYGLYKWVCNNGSCQSVIDNNVIGTISFYNNDDCGYVGEEKNKSGCTNQYSKSDVRKVVDKWAREVFNSSDLKEVKKYKARLVTYDELAEYLEYNYYNTNSDYFKGKTISAPDKNQWIEGFTYWTMSPSQDYNDRVWLVSSGHLIEIVVDEEGTFGAVRPVINVSKNVIKRESN